MFPTSNRALHLTRAPTNAHFACIVYDALAS